MNISRLCGFPRIKCSIIFKSNGTINNIPVVFKKLTRNPCRQLHCSRLVLQNARSSEKKIRSKSILNYAIALTVLTLGGSYAAVPLYGLFCQVSGFTGTVQHDVEGNRIEKLEKNMKRRIKVRFTSDVSANMPWKFIPQQSQIEVYPGETALAFYTATNPTERPIIGVSTYNVIPFDAGPYFTKIQCFCFEEQMLNPHEEVDMPVFFYIDPEYTEDPKLEYINEVFLSYTFFEAKEGMKIPMPDWFKVKDKSVIKTT